MSGSPWALAMSALGAAGDRLAAMMRERGEGDEAIDVCLTLLGALMDGYLNRLCADALRPSFLPCAGLLQRIGSPNPDILYRRAPIDPAAAYRLSGYRGTAKEVTLMPFEEPSMRNWPPFDLSETARGPEGAVEVLLSAERPAGYAGDWWRLEPSMSCLWLRSLSERWGEEEEPRLAMTRLGGPEPGSQGRAGAHEALAPLAAAVERIVEYGIRHVDELVAGGVVNRLRGTDYSAKGGMPLQWYHEGVFDLDEGQALLVEATLPEGCRYLSWSLTDRMLVTLDWTVAQSSLNTTQAAIDPDGVLRVVVCEGDPGVRNWLDAMGRRSGVIQCRFAGCSQPPSVTATLLAREALPPQMERVSPAEREAALLKRRTGAQLRGLL
jgi:hypothetical protein